MTQPNLFSKNALIFGGDEDILLNIFECHECLKHLQILCSFFLNVVYHPCSRRFDRNSAHVTSGAHGFQGARFFGDQEGGCGPLPG